MKPIIGILAEVDSELITKVQAAYIAAIEKSGGTPNPSHRQTAKDEDHLET